MTQTLVEAVVTQTLVEAIVDTGTGGGCGDTDTGGDGPCTTECGVVSVDAAAPDNGDGNPTHQ